MQRYERYKNKNKINIAKNESMGENDKKQEAVLDRCSMEKCVVPHYNKEN